MCVAVKLIFFPQILYELKKLYKKLINYFFVLSKLEIFEYSWWTRFIQCVCPILVTDLIFFTEKWSLNWLSAIHTHSSDVNKNIMTGLPWRLYSLGYPTFRLLPNSSEPNQIHVFFCNNNFDILLQVISDNHIGGEHASKIEKERDREIDDI